MAQAVSYGHHFTSLINAAGRHHSDRRGFGSCTQFDERRIVRVRLASGKLLPYRFAKSITRNNDRVDFSNGPCRGEVAPLMLVGGKSVDLLSTHHFHSFILIESSCTCLLGIRCWVSKPKQPGIKTHGLHNYIITCCLNCNTQYYCNLYSITPKETLRTSTLLKI